jgi:four helix bundle suffix protein
MSYQSPQRLIPPHGGYRKLLSYQMASLIYDLTVIFCKKFLDYKSRTNDQMVQAGRSGVQNIAEGSQASGTSKKTELKLVGVARASLEELLRDYEDFLRQRGLLLWDKNHPKSLEIRRISSSYTSYPSYLPAVASAKAGSSYQPPNRNMTYKTNRTDMTGRTNQYLPYLRSQESAANCLICLLHQANYLLDKQLERLEEDFVKNGGFTERLYNIRKNAR